MAQFYILSAYHSRPRDGMLTWWRPDGKGYCFNLNTAGKYDEAEALQIQDDEGRNIAIPCEIADAHCQRVFIWEPHLYRDLGEHAVACLKKFPA